MSVEKSRRSGPFGIWRGSQEAMQGRARNRHEVSRTENLDKNYSVPCFRCRIAGGLSSEVFVLRRVLTSIDPKGPLPYADIAPMRIFGGKLSAYLKSLSASARELTSW